MRSAMPCERNGKMSLTVVAPSRGRAIDLEASRLDWDKDHPSDRPSRTALLVANTTTREIGWHSAIHRSHRSASLRSCSAQALIPNRNHGDDTRCNNTRWSTDTTGYQSSPKPFEASRFSAAASDSQRVKSTRTSSGEEARLKAAGCAPY